MLVLHPAVQSAVLVLCCVSYLLAESCRNVGVECGHHLTPLHTAPPHRHRQPTVNVQADNFADRHPNHAGSSGVHVDRRSLNCAPCRLYPNAAKGAQDRTGVWLTE